MYQRMLTAEQSLRNDYYPFQERWVLPPEGPLIASEKKRSLTKASGLSPKSLQGFCSGWPGRLLRSCRTSPVQRYWDVLLGRTAGTCGPHALCGPARPPGCVRSGAVPREEAGSSPQGQWGPTFCPFSSWGGVSETQTFLNVGLVLPSRDAFRHAKALWLHQMNSVPACLTSISSDVAKRDISSFDINRRERLRLWGSAYLNQTWVTFLRGGGLLVLVVST